MHSVLVFVDMALIGIHSLYMHHPCLFYLQLNRDSFVSKHNYTCFLTRKNSHLIAIQFLEVSNERIRKKQKAWRRLQYCIP